MWGGAVRGVRGVAGEPPAGARCRAGFADAAAGKELDVSGARAVGRVGEVACPERGAEFREVFVYLVAHMLVGLLVEPFIYSFGPAATIYRWAGCPLFVVLMFANERSA